MSTSLHEGFVPAFTVGDRLRKARELTGMGAPAFAKEIGVSHKTINNAESDRHTVRKIVMNAYALATGVSVEWLETGIAPRPKPEGDHVGEEGIDPPTFRVETRHLRVAA